MIGDLGYAALILALATSVFSIVAFILGLGSRSERIMKSARNGLYAVSGLVALASLCLFYAFLTHDFSLEYVASYSSLSTSTAYLIAGFWAGNAGSLLFWSLVLGISSFIVVLEHRNKNTQFVPYLSITVLGTQLLLLALMVFVANPFQKLGYAPADGTPLKLLLQNPGMIFHPIMLLGGYSGLTIPFALMVAALFTRNMNEAWFSSMRRWMLVFWVLLGVGNILGMQWAYVELGWGGYWKWDPVENAGLMPWLTATAFLHSIMMQRRRGIFKSWNVGLVGASFFLAIFGTFLTRSDLLSKNNLSVHSFGIPGLDQIFLPFLIVGAVLFILLVSSRRSFLKDRDQSTALLSRETGFLLNNWLLAGTTFIIMLGSMLPLISMLWSRNQPMFVDSPFFNHTAGPLLIVLILLMGVCPLLAWFRSSPQRLLSNVRWPFYAAVGSAVVLLVLAIAGVTAFRGWAIVSLAICATVVASIFLEWARGTMARRRTRGESYPKAFLSLVGASRARYGGYVVHLGVVLLAIGILGSSFFGASTAFTYNSAGYLTGTGFTLTPGQTTAPVKGYTLKYESLSVKPSGQTLQVWDNKAQSWKTDNRMLATATLSIFRGERSLGTITTAANYLADPKDPTEIDPNIDATYDILYTQIGLRTNPDEDVYVSLDYSSSNFNTRQIGLDVWVNPLVLWIWVGGAVLLLGTVVALWPARRTEGEER